MSAVRRVQVIAVESPRGAGTEEDPRRTVTTYYEERDGAFTVLFEQDPCMIVTSMLGRRKTWPGGRANMDTVEFADDRPQGEGPCTE